jgi:hypothetical protein
LKGAAQPTVGVCSRHRSGEVSPTRPRRVIPRHAPAGPLFPGRHAPEVRSKPCPPSAAPASAARRTTSAAVRCTGASRRRRRSG